MVLVLMESWQLVAAHAGASKVQIRDPTAISPTSLHTRRIPPLRSIQQHKTTPTIFAAYHHFAPYTAAQDRCYAPSQAHPHNPSLSLLLSSTGARTGSSPIRTIPICCTVRDTLIASGEPILQHVPHFSALMH
jgi:hypothetical protein